jgi:death on curing protein
MEKIYFLTIEEIIDFNRLLIKLYGGIFGIRDYNLLDSALHQPQFFIAGNYIHKDIYLMAAAYLYHIIKNHPFIDGNKRTGIFAAINFLEYNYVEIDLDQKEFYKLAIDVANSKMSKQKIANFLKKKVVEN